MFLFLFGFVLVFFRMSWEIFIELGALWSCLFSLLVLLFILFFGVSSLFRFCNGNLEISVSKREVEFFVLILTTFSIFFGIYSFYHARNEDVRFKEEYEWLILENLCEEIDNNLWFIQNITSKKEVFMTSGEVPMSEFHYDFIEKSSLFVKNYTIRKKFLLTIEQMKISNNQITTFFRDYTYLSTIEEVNSYFTIKRQTVSHLIDSANSGNIKGNLEFFQREFNCSPQF